MLLWLWHCSRELEARDRAVKQELAAHLVTFKCLATKSKITPNIVIGSDLLCVHELVTVSWNL